MLCSFLFVAIVGFQDSPFYLLDKNVNTSAVGIDRLSDAVFFDNEVHVLIAATGEVD